MIGVDRCDNRPLPILRDVVCAVWIAISKGQRTNERRRQGKRQWRRWTFLALVSLIFTLPASMCVGDSSETATISPCQVRVPVSRCRLSSIRHRGIFSALSLVVLLFQLNTVLQSAQCKSHHEAHFRRNTR